MKIPTLEAIKEALIETLEIQKDGVRIPETPGWSRRSKVCLRHLSHFTTDHIRGWFAGLEMAPKLGLWWTLETRVENDPHGDLVALSLNGREGDPEPPDLVGQLSDLAQWMTTELEVRAEKKRREGKVSVANLTLDFRFQTSYPGLT